MPLKGELNSYEGSIISISPVTLEDAEWKEGMEMPKSNDSHWDIKLSIAEAVAVGKNPTVKKFFQIFLEEFGEPPNETLINIFTHNLEKKGAE